MEMIIKLKCYWAGYLARTTDNPWTTSITFWTPLGTHLKPRNDEMEGRPRKFLLTLAMCRVKRGPQ